MLPPQETRVPSLVWELRFPTPAYHAAPMGENNSIAAISNSFLKGEINFMGFPGSSEGKESACNVGDLGSILGLGRSPGEGKGYLLQYSGMENSMDSIVHGNAKGQT